MVEIKFPKDIMSRSELRKMGFPKAFLDRAHAEGDFSMKTNSADPSSNSTVIFYTKGLQKWMDQQSKIEKAAKS